MLHKGELESWNLSLELNCGPMWNHMDYLSRDFLSSSFQVFSYKVLMRYKFMGREGIMVYVVRCRNVWVKVRGMCFCCVMFMAM